MTFNKLHRLSVYLTLFLAALALNIDASDDLPIAPLYPLVVAIAAGLAFLTVDRDPDRGLPRDLATGLAVTSFLLALVEFWWDPNLLVLAIGHLLIYLQLVKMLMPKTVEDDWWLFLLGLGQVVIAGNQPGERTGFVLVAWSLVALWTLGLFFLRREALRERAAPGVTVLPPFDRSDPYPGLLDSSFLISALNVALTTGILGGLIFLVLPRWDTSARPRRIGGMSRHLVGFTDEVRLGQMGDILENDAIVMTIELYDRYGRVLQPRFEPLWRGVAMGPYEEGRWSRLPSQAVQFGPRGIEPLVPYEIMRQEIKLEPTDSDVLFAQRPIYDAEGREVVVSAEDGMLYRLDRRPDPTSVIRFVPRSGTFDYSVVSAADGDPIQPGEEYPTSRDLRTLYLGLPVQLRAPLREITGPLLAGIPNDDPERRARALESYLRDSGEFSYTLRQTVVDPEIDPVLDFLVNRREGHCEYFASALALMLRADRIPCRLINGFKGGDWNELGRVYHVREKYAHSWVEALVGKGPNGEPIWITLDPTPGLQREELVAQVGGFGRMRTLSDFVRYLWVFYVAGFNRERQETLIYQPIRELIRRARRGFALAGEWIRELLRWAYFRDFESFFSIRGFLVSFLGLLVLAGCVFAVVRIARRLGLRFRRVEPEDSDLAVSMTSYRRLARLLGDFGLRRPSSETPREFARRSADILSVSGSAAEIVADVPGLVVDAFYHTRYGHHGLPQEELSHLEQRLDALEVGLRPQEQ